MATLLIIQVVDEINGWHQFGNGMELLVNRSNRTTSDDSDCNEYNECNECLQINN